MVSREIVMGSVCLHYGKCLVRKTSTLHWPLVLALRGFIFLYHALTHVRSNTGNEVIFILLIC